jgi:hypothetical protein
VQKKDETLRSYIQHWSVIKNSAEDVSGERAIDAFSAGLRRSDLVEEIWRTKPRTVSELMDVANRFADGEDAYNNKRGHSPEVDRASRQRQRYHNTDSHAKRNQIAAGRGGYRASLTQLDSTRKYSLINELARLNSLTK